MFLPMNKKEMKACGWDEVDFVYVCGDSYVDHPSFGAAIITRVLEDCGYKVAFLAQPNWKNDSDFTRFGKPRLGFMVSAGNIDSMVAHYTAAKRRRHDDAYTAGVKTGKRPDRAVTVYCNIIRRLYPDSPIIIGGLEASLRRFAHYDYWSDSVMPSVLFDSSADILVYGMGELQTVEIANRLNQGYPVGALHDIRGICYSVRTEDYVPQSAVELPSLERVRESKRDYAVAARKELDEADAVRGKTLIQRHGKHILSRQFIQQTVGLARIADGVEYVQCAQNNDQQHGDGNHCGDDKFFLQRVSHFGASSVYPTPRRALISMFEPRAVSRLRR